jgi:hypothetical protein
VGDVEDLREMLSWALQCESEREILVEILPNTIRGYPESDTRIIPEY